MTKLKFFKVGIKIDGRDLIKKTDITSYTFLVLALTTVAFIFKGRYAIKTNKKLLIAQPTRDL